MCKLSTTIAFFLVFTATTSAQQGIQRNISNAKFCIRNFAKYTLFFYDGISWKLWINSLKVVQLQDFVILWKRENLWNFSLSWKKKKKLFRWILGVGAQHGLIYLHGLGESSAGCSTIKKYLGKTSIIKKKIYIYQSSEIYNYALNFF